MKNIKRAAKFFAQFSIIGYMRGRTLPSEVQLHSIRNFWKRSSDCRGSGANNVLVDALLFHPRYLSNNFTIANILAKINDADVTALVLYSSDHATKHLAKSFCIEQFSACYKPLNIPVIIKAIVCTLGNLPSLVYKKHIGISVIVDKTDIGEFIYDEYLRVTDLPTKRNIAVDYIFFIYRCLYLYFRYKQIFTEQKISHVAFGHTVYAMWGLLLPAAKAANKNIIFYNWCDFQGTGKLAVTKQLASSKVRKPGYMKLEYVEQLIQKYGQEVVLHRFDLLMSDKVSGKALNKDSANVYQGIEVNDEQSFLYKYSSIKKKHHIFIYSHAFVDAVRYSRWTIYSDYYTWLEETLLYLAEKSHNINIYIKPHPSEHLYKCDITSKMLVDRINQKKKASFVFLDEKVSNSVVFGIADSIITSNGTVSMEASCYGIPSILAGECGNELLNYNYSCKAERDYFSVLDKSEALPKLTKEKIFLAKVYYCWYADFMYLESPLLSLGEIHQPGSVDDEFTNLNELYGSVHDCTFDSLEESILSMSGEILEDVV